MVPEADVALPEIDGSPVQVIPQLAREGVQKIHLLFVVNDLGAIHLLKELDVTVEMGDAHGHVPNLVDRLWIPNDLPDLLKPDALAFADLVDDEPPAVEAIHHVSLLKLLAAFVPEALAKETPHDMVETESVDLVLIHGATTTK